MVTIINVWLTLWNSRSAVRLMKSPGCGLRYVYDVSSMLRDSTTFILLDCFVSCWGTNEKRESWLWPLWCVGDATLLYGM